MHATVKLFAQACDLAGTSQTELTLSQGDTVEDMLSLLIQRYPTLENLKSSLLVAINHDYVRSDYVIPEGADIACFPPVSGG